MNHRILNVAKFSLLLMAVAGCREKSPPAELPYAAGRVSMQSWSPSIADPLPGIDQAHLWSFWIPQTPDDQHPVLLIWSDVYGSKVVATDKTDGFEGRVEHIPIKFQLASKTSDDGTLTIAGTDYNTTNGSLFLVSTQQEMPVVMQLNQSFDDLDILTADGLAIDKKKVKALARTDAKISAFFRGAADKPNAP